MNRTAAPSGDHEIRAFFAVELGEAARESASAVAGALRSRPGSDGVRWVSPENFHVTLRFLGNIPSAAVAGVASAVAQEVRAHEPFEVELRGPRLFPDRRRPRAIALDVAPRELLKALAGSVECGVVGHGFESERRDFRSHLTLGRFRRRSPQLEDVPAPDPAPSTVSEVVLFRSILNQKGATYHALERLALRTF